MTRNFIILPTYIYMFHSFVAKKLIEWIVKMHALVKVTILEHLFFVNWKLQWQEKTTIMHWKYISLFFVRKKRISNLHRFCISLMIIDFRRYNCTTLCNRQNWPMLAFLCNFKQKLMIFHCGCYASIMSLISIWYFCKIFSLILWTVGQVQNEKQIFWYLINRK